MLVGVMATGYAEAEEIIFGENRVIDTEVTTDGLNNYGNVDILSTGSLVADNINNYADITNKGALNSLGNITNTGSVYNYGEVNITGSLRNYGEFVISGDSASLNVDYIINTSTLEITNGADISIGSIDNFGRIDITNNSVLNLTNQDVNLEESFNIVSGSNKLVSAINTDIIGKINVGDGINNTILNLDNINIAEKTVTNITGHARLNLQNGASIVLESKDSMYGDLILDGKGSATLDNFSLISGDKSTLEGSELAYFEQKDGELKLINNSILSVQNASQIKNGSMLIDSTSSFILNGSEDGENTLNLQNLKISGKFNVMNSSCELFKIENLTIQNNNIENAVQYTIDIDARSNTENSSDKFIGTNLTGDGTLNLSDWNLGGDLFGWDAPIDRDINLDSVFKFDNVAPTINLSVTKKEVFTPIGWYQLNNTGGMNGNWSLNLTRFNPQVYRGQVTTLAQWMNQLAIDDMLFNHSMLLPSFKDEDGGYAYSGTMANRYASTLPQYAPYQYSRKDGGLWMKMYGTFETLQMSQGLSNVGNNAYGTLIGADFGLKELKNGWKFMPTAYIGYNGAHQYYSGLGAYQNGGQAGFLGTWYKNNFIIGGLVYGGVYDNSMDIAGHTDSTFNYFAGAATKAAYNWRFHRDWVLQPNLFLAYNFFGQQNWHSAYGQMGMMSGMLNGVNIAPGLNLIWEKETFSIYATLQYMYNVNGAVGGRAGNVSLPHLDMDRGYIQYGIGFTKRFTDRFAGYFQTVFRNVGRTGVGFQLGFNWMIGK